MTPMVSVAVEYTYAFAAFKRDANLPFGTLVEMKAPYSLADTATDGVTSADPTLFAVTGTETTPPWTNIQS
jgi:hypothetical protein